MTMAERAVRGVHQIRGHFGAGQPRGGRRVLSALVVCLVGSVGLVACIPSVEVCNGASVALIRVRGSGDRLATTTDLNRSGDEGNSGYQLTLDGVSKAFRRRAALSGRSVNEIDLSYPALSTGQIRTDLDNMLDNILHGSKISDSKYLDSIESGRRRLKILLNEQFACPNQDLVLMGYSQGAYVVGDVLAQLTDADAAQVTAAVLFGDPRFDPADPTARGSFDGRRRGIASALYGTRSLGARYKGRVRNVCVRDDLVCQGPDPSYHQYVVGTLSLDLAKAVGAQQIDAHARGYACGGNHSDVVCRDWVNKGFNSVSKSEGNLLADRLALPRALSNQAEGQAGASAAAVPPVADAGPPYRFVVGQTATFSGANSSSETSDIVSWSWDLGNDGTFEHTSDEPTLEQTFGSAGTGTMHLVVTDADGLSASVVVGYEVVAPTLDLSVAVSGLSVSAADLGPIVSWSPYPAASDVSYVVRDQTGTIIAAPIANELDLSERPDVTAVTVTAQTAEGPSATAGPVAVAHGPTYTPMVPARLLETRSGLSTIDGRASGVGALAADGVFELPVAGRAGVPANATAAVLNVTVTGTRGSGFVTVYPCGANRPTASSLNYTAGETIANSVIAKIGADGKVCVYSKAATDMVIDITGLYSDRTQFTPLAPARVLDTRAGADITTVDGAYSGVGYVLPGGFVEVQIAGRAGVPIDAGAVAVNLTVTDAQNAGYATVVPCEEAGNVVASNLNFAAAQTIANLVVARLTVDGRLCVYSSAIANVVLDVTGYHKAGVSYTPTEPRRLLETRPGLATFDGQANGGGAIPADGVFELPVVGRAGVPTGTSAAVLNVTVTGPRAAGFVTVYPCGAERPTASSLNYKAGDTVANSVITKVGIDGKVCVYTKAATDMVIDLNGFHAYT